MGIFLQFKESSWFQLEIMDKVAAFGVTVNKLPADQIAGMVERVMPLWEEWADAGDSNRVAYDLALKAMGY